MKIKLFAKMLAGWALLAVGATACNGTPANSAANQPNSDAIKASSERGSSYFCDRSKDETFTTFARASTGRIPVIRWESKYFEGSGYTPEKRCLEVSEKFQAASNNGLLNFITTGMENRQPVVCVSSAYGGPCKMTLWTLKPSDNASEVIQKLWQGAYATGPLSQSSGGSQIYIDMKEFLRTAPVEEGS